MTDCSKLGERARAQRLFWAGVSLLLVAVPFLSVSWVPAADLPQHVAQVRLLGEAVGGDSVYRVQWTTPYATLYLVLLGPWLLLPPLAAAKAGVLCVALLWVAVLHRLAAVFERPHALAVLASPLVFNHTLYWGFLNFLLGFVAFGVWMEVCERLLVRRDEATPWRAKQLVALGATSLLVYSSHALWLVMAVLWLGGSVTMRLMRRLAGVGELVRVASALVPVGLLALTSAVRIGGSSFATPPSYAEPLWQRLDDPAWAWRRAAPWAAAAALSVE